MSTARTWTKTEAAPELSKAPLTVLIRATLAVLITA